MKQFAHEILVTAVVLWPIWVIVGFSYIVWLGVQ